MRKQDLFKLSIGTYELTDNIDNYYYTLKVGLTNDNERCYSIRVKGSINSDSIFMLESYVNEEGEHTFYEGDVKYKILSAIAGVGGLFIHSNDTHSMLRDLKIIPRGSFKKFIENTK